MKRIMRLSGIKTIVVCLSEDNKQEFDIDTEIFDDPYAEAITRAIEQSRKIKGKLVRPITECWEKKNPKKTYLYNSYRLLLNAGCYSKAEDLRIKLKMQSNIDLAKEPLHGGNGKNSN